MTTKTITTCDECKKAITQQHWRVKKDFPTSTFSGTTFQSISSSPPPDLHFCDSQCAARYFGEITQRLNAK